MAQEDQTPLSAFLSRAESNPEAPALVADGHSWSCERLARGIERLTRSLQARGVKSGDRIVLHMFNIPEVVIAYCACFRLGVIAVPLNTRYKPDEVKAMVARVEPALYLGQAELYGNVEEVDTAILPLEARYITHLGNARKGVRVWSDLISAKTSPGEHVAKNEDLDAPAVLLATSGSTGRSKLVVWTARTLASLKASAVGRGITENDTVLITTPMMHGSGAYYVSSCLLQGALMVLSPQFNPGVALDLIEEYRCTTTCGMPFMCAEVSRCQREKARNLNSLRLCTVAGDICSREIEQAFQAVVDRPLFSFWAATEDVGAMVVGSDVGPFMRPVPEVEVQIVDDVGQPVEWGETGELLVRSPTTSPGYWNGPNDIDPLPDKWFHSGDLVHAENNGDLRYMGRKKDLIVRGGSNISPIEVESVMRRHPAVKDAAIAGLADPYLGQRVGAAIVLAEGQYSSVAPEILDFVQRWIADYKVPEKVVIVEDIPRNTLNKIDRNAVANRIKSGVSAFQSDRRY